MADKKEDLSDLVLISSTENTAFAKSISEYLDKPLAGTEKTGFKDTDFKARIAEDESVRGKHACLIMTYEPPIAERFHEMVIWTDALCRGSLEHLTLVWPYFLGARQDRKTRRGEPINIAAFIHAIEGVADTQVSKLGWMTCELHSPQCEGYSMTFDNFGALPLFARNIRRAYNRDVVMVSPDAGGSQKAVTLAKMIGVDISTCVPKIRGKKGEVEKVSGCYDESIIGGKTAVVIDDIIDSGGTLVQACEGLREDGAIDIAIYATHALLNPPAEEILREIGARVVTTDTVFQYPEKLESLGITQLPISYVVAEAIRKQHIGESTRELREEGAVDIIANRIPGVRDIIG